MERFGSPDLRGLTPPRREITSLHKRQGIYEQGVPKTQIFSRIKRICNVFAWAFLRVSWPHAARIWPSAGSDSPTS